jgi:hypothetical protein
MVRSAVSMSILPSAKSSRARPTRTSINLDGALSPGGVAAPELSGGVVDGGMQAKVRAGVTTLVNLRWETRVVGSSSSA